MDNFKTLIEQIDIENVSAEDISVIENVINLLDTGKIRVAEPLGYDWEIGRAHV